MQMMIKQNYANHIQTENINTKGYARVSCRVCVYLHSYTHTAYRCVCMSGSMYEGEGIRTFLTTSTAPFLVPIPNEVIRPKGVVNQRVFTEGHKGTHGVRGPFNNGNDNLSFLKGESGLIYMYSALLGITKIMIT